MHCPAVIEPETRGGKWRKSEELLDTKASGIGCSAFVRFLALIRGCDSPFRKHRDIDRAEDLYTLLNSGNFRFARSPTRNNILGPSGGFALSSTRPRAFGWSVVTPAGEEETGDNVSLR